MTTYTDFAPSIDAVFQFQATLDGNVYTVSTPWNAAVQRFYLQIISQTDTTPVLYTPLVGSPPDYDISMTKGYFTSTLVYRTQNAQFEVSP